MKSTGRHSIWLVCAFTFLTCFSLGAEEKAPKVDPNNTYYRVGLMLSGHMPFKGEVFEGDQIDHFLAGFSAGTRNPITKADMEAILPTVISTLQALEARAKDIQRKEQLAELAKITMPLDMEILDSQGKAHTLGGLLKDKKALMIDFWASWCGPCMSAMPRLMAEAKSMAPKGVVVLGMNTEDAATAEGIRQEKGIDFPWLVEPSGRPLSQLLKVDSIPRMVIVDPQGKIVYNGHPGDHQGIHGALATLGVTHH